MSDAKMRIYHIIGGVVVILVGSLLHYVYEWSGNNKIVGVFGAVNESTWEHMKLLFWPMLIFSTIEYFAYGKDLPNFVAVKALSLLIGLIAIPVIFYTYTGIIGDNYLIADILVFVISVFLAYIFSCYLLHKPEVLSSKAANIASIAIFIITALSFIIFTFKPPEIALFYDPSEKFNELPE